MGIYYCEECERYVNNDVELACVHPLDNSKLICPNCCDKLSLELQGALTDIEKDTLLNALKHQIKHDERRIYYLENKFRENLTQDLTLTKKRVVAAKSLIQRIINGEVHCLPNTERRIECRRE